MSNTNEKRNLSPNQVVPMKAETSKEVSQMKAAGKFTKENVKEINAARDKLDSLYNIRRAMNSLGGLNSLLKKRREFYEKYGVDLGKFVLWGRYLLTDKGTIQEIDQRYVCGKPVELTTLEDFMKTVSSIKPSDIVRFPTAHCLCKECHKPITIQDVAKGNFTVKDTHFIHVTH